MTARNAFTAVLVGVAIYLVVSAAQERGLVTSDAGKAALAGSVGTAAATLVSSLFLP